MDSDDQYFLLENRVASFRLPQPVTKKRASTAARAPKALEWPHKALSPVAFAKAGFFFEPHPKSPDNVVCFLCEKSLDGWEETDNPLEEHLKHSPTCGWAIMAAIEAGFGNYGKVPPLDPAMIEARKATFAGRWPYESKKGFKCKIKKLVEGGWKYTPSLEADDMTTCAYCNLALEGWESDDNPFDEHYRREPGCLFFALINQYPAPKKGRAKAARASKASSRLSVQSVATVATSASDVASIADITADHDDSVMTTASTMTQGGKKTTKGRKAATGKGRKTKAKKDEAVDVLEDEPQAEEPPQPTVTRGRKRASDAMEDPADSDVEAPAPKKRATRTRASTAVDNSSVPDTEMVDAVPAKQPAKKKARASSAKTRKVSAASVTSRVSIASLRGAAADDDELDRQLEADLERYHSDADDMAVEQAPEAPAPATRGRPKKAATTRKTSAQKQKAQSESYAMFDPTPMVPDEAEIEADLEALQAEMEVEKPTATDTLVVPKKGRKAGTRKASKQKKAKEPEPQPEAAEAEEAPLPEPSWTPVQEPKQLEQEAEAEPQFTDDPDASTGTVVTKPVKRGRGRPKKSTASQASVEEQEQRQSVGSQAQVETQAETPPTRKSLRHTRESATAPTTTPQRIARKPVAAASQPKSTTPIPTPVIQSAAPKMATPIRKDKTHPAYYPPSASRLPQPPSTPRTRPAPSALRANQTVISPAKSPQSSDAENHPLSLQPAASVMPKRIVLAPTTPNVAQTPRRSSPAKRNIVAGLQSSLPWQPTDIDLLFSSSPIKGHYDDHDDGEDKENSGHGKAGGGGGGGVARLLRKGGELTSPEKRMTVEEWVYHNAGQAEQKLKGECEAMVSAFEREGGRAMRVLEGLVVDS